MQGLWEGTGMSSKVGGQQPLTPACASTQPSPSTLSQSESCPDAGRRAEEGSVVPVPAPGIVACTIVPRNP